MAPLNPIRAMGEKTLNSLQQGARSGLEQFTVDLVRAAGKLIIEYLGRATRVSESHFDLTTDADLASQELLVEKIHSRFPDDQILAEEGFVAGSADIAEFCWVIDPLDGTVNYAAKIPFFSISLALLHQGDPILGCVYDPIGQELYLAQRGSGSFLNGKRLFLGERRLLQTVPIGVSTGFLDITEQNQDDLPLLGSIRRYGKIRIFGSQALQLCYVAAGRLTAAISWESRLWDDVAGALIVLEAGAHYSDFRGKKVFPLTAGSRLLQGNAIHSVAAPATIHQQLLALVASLPVESEDVREEKLQSETGGR